MFNDDFKRRVKDATNIVDVVQSAVGKLTRAGRNWKACCPFHNEKSPSFNVDPEAQFFKCFGCGKGGDVFTFVMLMERVEFPEALKILADRAGLQPPIADPRAAEQHHKDKEWKSYLYKLNEAAAKFYCAQLHSPAGKLALEYLAKRGLTDEICTRFGLGYSPAGGQLFAHLRKMNAPERAIVAAGLATQKEDTGRIFDFFFDRLMFPIRDIQGRVIAFGGRILGDGEPKYLNTRETALFSKTKTVYGIDLAREKIVETRKAYVVEGYTDVMMCHQHGVTNVVACLGTAITPDHMKQLKRVADELHILTDSDKAGANASEKSLPVLMQEEMPAKIVRLPGEAKDPCDFLLANGIDAFQAGLQKTTELFDYKFERVQLKHNLNTPLGLKNAVEELMTLISVVPDPLVKNEYRRRVSIRLNLSERDLEFEAKRNAPQSLQEKPVEDSEAYSAGDAPPPENDLAKAERELLRFLFHEPAWMDEAVTNVDLRALTGKHEKPLGQAILKAMSEGTLPPDPSIIPEEGPSSLVAREVLKKLDDVVPEGAYAEMHAKQVCIELAGAAMGSGGAKLDADSKFAMLVKPVKLAHLENALVALNGRIRKARLNGDTNDEEQAYQEAAQVRKQLAQLKASK